MLGLRRLCVGIFLVLGMAMGMEAQVLARFPSIHPDAELLAFSYQGDIWISADDGSDARRITVHEAYDSHPRWSRDGSQLAFQSNRYGSNDVFTYDLASGEIERHTYYSGSDSYPAWRSNGGLVFRSARTYKQLERESEIYTFDDGLATPKRALDALGLMAEPSYNDRYWGLVKGYCRTTREAYTGSARQNIWWVDRKTETYEPLAMDSAQDIMLRWAEEEVFILSARTGGYNIFVTEFSEKGPGEKWSPLTDFEERGISYFDVSRDGQKLVFERLGEVYTMERGEKPQKVTWQLPADYTFYPEEMETKSSGAGDYALSPNGKYIAFELRGDLFVMRNDKENKRTVRLTDHPARDQDPQWLTDSTLVFRSDREGKEELHILRSSDEGLGDLYWSFARAAEPWVSRDQMITDYALSPDRDKIVVVSEGAKMEMAEVDSTGKLGGWSTLWTGWSSPSSVEWSPDGQWISYEQSDLNFNRDVFVRSIDPETEPINISMHPRRDGSAVWSPDGKKLAFTSQRNNGDYDLWMVWLQEEDYLRNAKDWEQMEEMPAALRDRLSWTKDTSSTVSVVIDEDNIYRRLSQLTSYSGSEYGVIFDGKSEHLYFIKSDGKERDLMKVKWDGSDAEKVMSAKGLGRLQRSPDGKHLHFTKSGKLQRLPDGKKKAENLPFQAKMRIDYQAEQEQMFDEAYRLIRARFYDPDFHGRDLEKLKSIYRPIALQASTRQDFRDMFNAMLGQLNASHMGMYGGSREDVQRRQTAQLGVDLLATPDGWEVQRVIPHSPAERPESRLEKGDLIIQIEGNDWAANQNAYQYLEEKVQDRIWLKVQNTAGEIRDVYLRTASSMRSLLYEEWVADRRALTEKYSKGRLGYIHIQGMNRPSFEVFERELMAAGYGKDGIIIDVRYNGGGWTTDLLMTVLDVRQHAYTIPRNAASSLKDHKEFRAYYPFSERLPLSAWTKPSAALCNSNSYSNAEIFSHAYKQLDIGPLIGEPTFGAVISTGGARLIDGSLIRLPFRGWFVKATGKNMDMHPAVPDYIVHHPPGQKATGEDAQLEKAVNVLLADMGEE